ncbi:MAG TPA: Na/Pi cotransporter family protein [Flavobacteriales bacterium]|jgi:phosphate:Na+ symporter|nr:Na/Pi cotransporter family protein [Flavobacteriales bacterium]HJN64238.1 Na/Pi cotransporter family protein [Flavobacteriales bacterium]
MEFGIFELLQLIGALGFFIFGMKIMSDGIQKVAGSKMRSILSKMTSNRFLGITTGFLITALLQSSSATTVMIVSFVNAGLLSLVESIGVIMGANIGTTITAWLIAILGFKVKISSIALPIIAIGFPMMFASKANIRSWAEVFIGFALLFMGLDELKNSVPDLKQNPEFLSFLANYADMGYLSTIIFIGVGTILTLVVQSSSAAMALTLVMCYEGYIPFELAAAMVLGENIGTTITANLAAMVGNVHAKRSARAHFIFNIFGVIWMIIALPFFVETIDNYMVLNMQLSPLNIIGESVAIPIGLSIFHTTFNIINVLLMVGFIPLISSIVIKMQPSKGELDEEFHLEHIGTGLMSTTELSIVEANKEVVKFGERVQKLFSFMPALLEETNSKKIQDKLSRIKKYEDITDRMEVEIADYLAKASQGELSDSASIKVRSMISIINDMERIGDICYQMSIEISRKKEQNVNFLPEMKIQLDDMIGAVNDTLNIMQKNLKTNYSQVTIDKADRLEITVNTMRNKIRKNYLQRVEKGEVKIQAGMIYINLIHSLEKIGDHVFNITEAIIGE